MNVLLELRRSWQQASLVAVLILAASGLFLLAVPPSYTATAVVAVVPKQDTEPSGELVRLAVPTYASLATSDSLAATMAQTYGEDRLRLRSAVGAQVAPSTNTVVVSVRWGDPERAALLANGVVEQLLDFSERDPILTSFVVAPAVAPAGQSFPPSRATLVAGALAAVVGGLVTAWARRPRRHQ